MEVVCMSNGRIATFFSGYLIWELCLSMGLVTAETKEQNEIADR